MGKLGNILKTIGPRLLGQAASALAALILLKTKGVVTIDPNTLVEVITAAGVAYAATHRGVSAVVNPGDAAKGRVADGIKDAADNPMSSPVVTILPKED